MANKDLDCLIESSVAEQKAAFESAVEKLEDKDFEVIEKACQRLVVRLQYANIKQRIEYSDALEILAKLGMFLIEAEGQRRKAKDG